MQYPSRSDYCSAIRNPQFAFRYKDTITHLERDLDSSLVTGKAFETINSMGLKNLWSASGSCAIVFKYETFSPNKTWAIRCFYRSSFEVIKHYQKSLHHLSKSNCRHYFVDFFLLEKGIRVLGNCYPVLKMEWVEGQNLKKFLKNNLGNKNHLNTLAQLWQKLSQDLLTAGIAHGDLQHGNLLILNSLNQLTLKLIDYDSLYFSQESYQFDDTIKGLSDYQHPLRSSLEKRCLAIDFFPQLVIYTSILALAENPNLWKSYKLDEREGLLFSRTDFQNPQEAEIFRTLSHLPPPLPTLAYKLQKICQVSSFEHIPHLAQFLSDEPIILPQKFQKISILTKQNFSFIPHFNPAFFWHKGKDWLTENVAFTLNFCLNKVNLFEIKKPLKGKINNLSSPSSYFPVSMSVSSPLETFGEISLSSDKPLQWDPRLYKVNTPKTQALILSESNSLSNPLISSLIQPKIDNVLSWVNQVRQDVKQTYDQVYHQQIEQFQAFQLKLTQEIIEQVQQLKTRLEPKTWTSREVASQLGCSVSWCHRQRYRFPDYFSEGKHYYKNQERQIYWTQVGINQLRELQVYGQADAVPPTALPTKQVSSHLGISLAWIIHVKTNYKSQLQEGIHYYLDTRNRYYWTSEGMAYLQQLHRLIYPRRG